MKLSTFTQNLNLKNILFIGLVLRLIAALFAKGYAAMDDHFLVIEVSQSWVDGFDIFNWFTNSYAEFESGRSYIYPGFHFVLFTMLEGLGIHNPDTKMYVVRILHAFYSLLVIYYGYKITEKFTDKKTANTVGLLLATLFFMPVMSIKNLVEVVPIPFLMMGVWNIFKSFGNKKYIQYSLIAGLTFALAFSLRYQVALFILGVIIGMIIKRKWKELVFVGIGGMIPFLLIHGWMEYELSGVAFGKLRYYIEYNIINSTSYFNHPWYNYFMLVPALMLPPLGVFLFVGTFFNWRKQPILFWGVMVFFAFHSYFPNKQERFMYTMMPFFVILGVMGWNYVLKTYKFWERKPWIMKFSWRFFWSLNIILLLVFSTYYSKRSRVETMLYLHGKGDTKAIVIEDQYRHGTATLPYFYLGDYVPIYEITIDSPIENFKARIDSIPEEQKPNYVLFASHNKGEKLEDRIKQMEEVLPNLTYETTINVSFIDWLNAAINPVVNNRNYFIYKVGD